MPRARRSNCPSAQTRDDTTMLPNLRAGTSFLNATKRSVPPEFVQNSAGYFQPSHKVRLTEQAGCLFCRTDQFLDGVHHGALIAVQALLFDLRRKVLESLDVNDGVVVLCVVVAAEPQRDIVRIRLQEDQLLAGD